MWGSQWLDHFTNAISANLLTLLHYVTKSIIICIFENAMILLIIIQYEWITIVLCELITMKMPWYYCYWWMNYYYYYYLNMNELLLFFVSELLLQLVNALLLLLFKCEGFLLFFLINELLLLFVIELLLFDVNELLLFNREWITNVQVGMNYYCSMWMNYYCLNVNKLLFTLQEVSLKYSSMASIILTM
jgi:hypothetical protein